jgi:hypothetical protein
MGVQSNIKADKAAIIKRRIHPPPSLSRGILIVLQISLIESLPQNRRDAIVGLPRHIFKRFCRLFGAPPIYPQLLEEIDALSATSTSL